MGQVAGKEGAVAFGLIEDAQMDLDSWDVDEKCDVILTKSFRQLGKTAADGAFVDVLISLKGYFSQDEADQPILDFGLFDGAILTELCLYVTRGTGALFFFFPTILVLTSKCMTKVEGRVDFEATLVPQGVFYWPGDVIPP